MSDDDDEYDDEYGSLTVDESFLNAVDDIEARAAQRPQPSPGRSRSTNPPAPHVNADAGPSRPAASRPVPSSDDYGDFSFTAEALAQIDSVATAPRERLPPVQGVRAAAPSTGGARPLGYTGSSSGRLSLQTHLPFRNEAPTYTKGKRWDRTAFAASGRRIGAAKTKDKGKEQSDIDEDDEEEAYDLLAPPPKDSTNSTKPYEPQKHTYNAESIKTYIYPTNHPKRDYQFEIIRACLTDNCLVALPTGLGKTFVAGVVMLNYYRWFPSGKIVFLAPTKPLVNQQIEACQLACGIPSADAAVMTGSSVSASSRERLWDERRVFYCTPQTLDNDLKSGAVDPRDIVLAVFDEAHKASGSYAYTTILAYMTARHPYFRVLALTATPGKDVPTVQGVVDALHISRIEIREAEAPEIRKYQNEKKTERHVIPMGPVVAELRDRWAVLMKPYIQKMVAKDILMDRDLDAKRLRPFRITAKRMEITRDRRSTLKWAIGPLTQIEKMARAMGYLLEFSLGMFHSSLMEIAGNSTSEGKKGNSRAGANSIRNNIEFRSLLGDVEGELSDIRRHRNGRSQSDRHPKMHKTLELLLAHFAQADEDEKVHGIKNDTRAMVFCSLRECVLEVVDMLNEHPDLLRATKFVGQSQGKQEKDKGFNQKEQKQTIQEFKEGKYNVLVSTSIGEEGLDIGEVDFVVIYDMPKQSIKLLQRIGRTGRKRSGNVHVLMSENREDLNWDTAQRTHRDIQEEILHSRNLELFEDVERLLPPGPLPECVEQHMDVDPWDPEDKKRTRKLAAANGTTGKVSKAPAKRKRGAEIPEEAHEGFKSVVELLKKAKKRGKKAVVEEVEDVDEGMSSPDDLESLFRQRPHREHAVQETAKPKAMSPPDSDDNEEDDGGPVRHDALDFINTRGTIQRRSPLRSSVPSSSSPAKSSEALFMDAPSSQVIAVDSSPRAPKEGLFLEPPSSQAAGSGNRLTPRTAAAAGFSQIVDMSMSDDDDVLNSSPPPSRAMPPPPLPPSVMLDTPLNHKPAATPPSCSTEPTPFPVRRRPATKLVHVSSSETGESPGTRPLQRLRRRHLPNSSSPPLPSPAPRKRRSKGQSVAHLMDIDAGVSGSGSSDESDDSENESDRQFAGHFQATQAPRGYNQAAVYAAGLSTQGASRTGLAFGKRDGNAFLAKARRPVVLSQQPREPDSEDEYELGSFICDDDEEMAFNSQSDPLGSGL